MDKYINYITVQGDTFDMLALKAYGNEFLSHLIIQANPECAGVLVFDAGVKLNLPKVSKKATASLPPWR